MASTETMIVGVDLATRRIALACPEAEWCFKVKMEGTRDRRDYPTEADAGRELGRQARLALHEAISEGYIAPFLQFWFERPMAGRNIKTAIGQGLSGGASLGALPGSLHEVSNSHWKKELIGNGNATPQQYRAWLAQHHPTLAALSGEDADVAAAHCIALWAGMAQGS